MVDVDHRHAQPLQEAAREDLHVAREHDEIDPSREQLEQLRLRLGLAAGGNLHVVVGHVEAGDVASMVGMVRDDGDDIGLELAATPAPEEIEQTMVVARSEHRRPLPLVGVREAPVHLERLRGLSGKGTLELRPPLVQPLEPELHAHEEGAALGIGRVLVGAEDVRVGLGQEAGDGGHDPVPVGT